MTAANDFLLVEPIKNAGVIQIEEGNTFLVKSVGSAVVGFYKAGDKVVCEASSIVQVFVSGQEQFYVKEGNVLGVEDGREENV